MELTKVIPILSLALIAMAEQCYWPDTSRADNLEACSPGPDNVFAPCCYQGHYCLSNGLCLDKTGMTLYRAGCTDSSFNSQSCGNYCSNDNFELAGMAPLYTFIRVTRTGNTDGKSTFSSQLTLRSLDMRQQQVCLHPSWLSIEKLHSSSSDDPPECSSAI